MFVLKEILFRWWNSWNVCRARTCCFKWSISFVNWLWSQELDSRLPLFRAAWSAGEEDCGMSTGLESCPTRSTMLRTFKSALWPVKSTTCSENSSKVDSSTVDVLGGSLSGGVGPFDSLEKSARRSLGSSTGDAANSSPSEIAGKRSRPICEDSLVFSSFPGSEKLHVLGESSVTGDVKIVLPDSETTLSRECDSEAVLLVERRRPARKK